jgi:two-component system cell cycle sensor histidine kinase PleC
MPGATADAKPRRASDSGRGIRLLVALFVIALIGSVAVQFGVRWRDLDRRAAVETRVMAVAAAAQTDGVISHAWGVAAGALDTGSSASPAAVVTAAARANAVSRVALFSGEGVFLAGAGQRAQALGTAALSAAPAGQDWAGAVRLAPDSPPRIALVRRGAGRTLVAILEPGPLLAQPGGEARVALLAGDAVIAAAGDVTAETTAATALGVPVGADLIAPHSIVSTPQGRRTLGTAAIGVTGVRVVVSAPLQHGLGAILPAMGYQLLLVLAPMAAVGALLLMMRQTTRRADVAEAEMVRAATAVRLTADGAHAGVFEWRLSDNMVTLSDEAMRLLHAPQETMALGTLVGLAITEDRNNAAAAFRKARETGALDARFRISVGPTLAWIEARGLAIEEEDGPPRVVGTVLDVTQRWEAELRASTLERRLREAIESYSGPFALWDARRRIVLWNRAYAQTFQLGKDILRPGASYESLALAAAASIRRESVDPADPQSREIEAANGEWMRLVERRTTEGGLVTVGIDITDLKRQEQALTENRRKLLDLVARLETSEQRNKALAREAEIERRKAEEANAAKTTFLANMSHELRTPLNAVIGFSEIMHKELFGPIGNEQYRAYALDIYNSGAHLLDLINDVLDMAKIEAGRFNLRPGPLDPQVAIDQAVRLTRRRAEEKGLQLVVDAEDLPEIEADHRAVKQMLLNLLSNAIKFTDTGAVMVYARGTSFGLELRVVDTGCGIAREDLSRLARPFEQVETDLTRSSSGGTGLGLALTKSLAEMHGGRLVIESELGRGTMVAIHLPLRFGGEGAGEAKPEAAE